uniref:CCR4-NOT transcription complex subunit 10 n=1 Tax=Cyprinus carpio TaxID=7962 RepID=A0A8C2CJD1_CYPCA
MAETTGDMKHDSISSPGISDQEKEMASSAFEAFKTGSYDESLKHLDSLQELNKEDYKITMNKAITEFYKSGQTTTSTLKQTLMTLKNQMHTAVDDIDGLDDVENSILYYNQAVIHYHMRQYSEAISIVEKLYQFLEPFEEKFAQAVCFLLVDLYLLTFQPEKALHLLAVLEKLAVKDGNSKNGKGEDIFIHLELCYTLNFEYLRGNYRKAVKLLNSSNIAEHPGPLKTGECVRCMFWNNLGCIHFAMGKHNLGLFYFKKALQENDHICAQLGDGTAKKFTGIPMCALLANKRYELLYNCGIQLLHIGRPLAAFECLMEAVQVYHSNPRLWLRLAECCITANKGSSEQETKGLPSKKGIVQAVVGQGYHRKIVLASQSTQNTIYSEGQSAAIPVASMEFAAICLRNALLLLPEHQQHDSKSDNGSKSCSLSGSTETSETSDACSGKAQEGDKFIPAAPSSPLRKQEVENLRCSILACSAYVALALGDNLMALNHAEKLLHQTKLSGSLKFLGHLYAAEALISLDRISDAIAHLNPENVTDVSLGVSSSEQEQASDKGDLEPVESSGKQTPLCYPSSVSSARATMLFNLGSAYCLRSEYEKARKCLHQAASMVNTKEIPPEAILLGVYLELQNGNTQLALQIIKRNQLLPSVKPASSPDLRKKPLPFQSSQPVQPIQTPSSFTQVQRK